jgi:hypothetical protein
MKMQTIKRRNHYVPASYLSSFASKDNREGLIWVFDKELKVKYLQTCENVAYKKDYYKVDIEDEAPDYFENELMKIEGIGKSIIKEIIETKEMPDEPSYSEFMYYMAFLAVRVPKVWEHITKQYEDNHKELMIMITRSKDASKLLKELNAAGESISSVEEAENIRQFILKGEYNVSVDNTYKIKMMIELIEPLPALLGERNWAVIYRTENQTNNFVTSDCPIMLYQSDPSHMMISPGFGLRYTEILFPLSKELALVGTFDDKLKRSKRTRNWIIKECNDITYSLSKRFVYSYSEKIGSIKNKNELDNYQLKS